MKTYEKCPTEEVCVSDKINGECGRTGRTLEEHCHSDVEGGGCKLYWTKAGSTPLEFQGFMDALNVCRARQKAGLELPAVPFWGERAYLVGSAVYSLVQAEHDEKAGDEDGKQSDFSVTEKGDSDAFALIAEHIQSSRVTNVKRIYGRKHNSSGGYPDPNDAR